MTDEPLTLRELLQGAIQLKTEAEGKYSLRNLERDSKVNYSYASRVVKGERQPSRDVVIAIAEALRPYVDVDEVLLAAGFLPENPIRASLLRRAGRYPLQQLARLLDSADLLISDPVEKEHIPEQSDQKTDTKKATP